MRTAGSTKADVVIVGARCAGAATARLLAAAGLEVVVLDRSEYGSDTLSTHALMRGAVIQLQRWGVLDAVEAAGTPPIRRATFIHPGVSIPIDLKPGNGVDALYAPRRTVLDAILVDAARAAGASFRFGVVVTDVLSDGTRVTGVRGHDRDRNAIEIEADLVIGADGMYSRMAPRFGAPVTYQGRGTGAAVYAYYAGVEADGYEWYFGNHTAAGVIPTNGGEVVIFAATSSDRWARVERHGAESMFRLLVEQCASELWPRLANATRTGRYRVAKGMSGYLRSASGPGWALVGDAASFKDPIAAHGITDALRDAEGLARAITAPGSTAAALAEYEARRDELTLPIMRVAEEIGAYAWDTAEVQELLLALNASMNNEVKAMTAMYDDVRAA